MSRKRIFGPVLGVGALLLSVVGVVGAATAAMAVTGPAFSHPDQITNPYLPITKFHRCELAGKDQAAPGVDVITEANGRVKLIGCR